MSSGWSVGWFAVALNEQSIRLEVSPPGREPWQAVIPWDSVARVCFEAEGPMASDSLYVFTSLRPESWVIPVEAAGAEQLLDELIRRGLFDARLAIEAMQAEHGLFCWPPGGPGSNRDARQI